MKWLIVVPILNELQEIAVFTRNLRHALAAVLAQHASGETATLDVKVVFSDGGSQDGSQKWLENELPLTTMPVLPFVQWQVLLPASKGDFAGPEIATRVRQAVSENPNFDCLLVLPVDCTLSEEGLTQLFKLDQSTEDLYGVFSKRYLARGLGWKFYAGLQNLFLLRIFRYWQWTNGVFLKQHSLPPKSSEGEVFLSDLHWAEQLSQQSTLIVMKIPIEVSIRRYQKDGPLRRMLGNILILLVFVWGVRDQLLLQSYYRQQITIYDFLRAAFLSRLRGKGTSMPNLAEPSEVDKAV